MPHTPYVWGVRIYLDSVITQDTSIGLYTSGTSELRWVEAPITFAATSPTTWSSTMLTGDIDAISQSADFTRGGAVAQASGTTIRVNNTAQLSTILATYGVDLSGLKVEIWEFTCSIAGAESSRARIYTGVCGGVQWNETEISISIDDASFKRRSQLLSVVNDVEVPATFGQIDKAKMVRTEFSETTYSNEDILGAYKDFATVSSAFPYVDSTPASPTLTFSILLAREASTETWSDLKVDLTGKYLKVIDGTKCSGEYRRISSFTITNDPTVVDGATINCPTLHATIESYFTDILIGSTDATISGNAWFEIAGIEREYALDAWKCHAFIDENLTTEVSENLDLYSYSEPKKVPYSSLGSSGTLNVSEGILGFYLLPQYAYSQKSTTYKNTVIVDVKLFNSSPDQLDSVKIKEVSSVQLIDDATLLNWSGGSITSSAAKIATGIYNYAIPIPTSTLSVISGAIGDVTDKDGSSLIKYRIAITDARGPIFAFKFKTVDTDFEMDAAYLGIRAILNANSGVTLVPIEMSWRRFFGNATSIYSGSKTINHLTDYTIDDVPDFYYLTNKLSTNNLNFYVAQDTAGALLSGYKTFQIDKINNNDSHNSIHEYAFFVDTWFCPAGTNFDISINEIALILVRSVSIKDSIFTGIRGRIFDDTWGTRKTAADLMDSPVDIAEHILRLQNWSETGDAEEWGKAYAANAAIKTGAGDGSFDDTANVGPAGGTDVSAWLPHDLTVARQILTSDDGYSDTALRSLCRATFCCNYRDVDGKESIRYLMAPDTAATAITLSSVIGKITIQEPKSSDVYVQPFVKYNMSYGSEKFGSTMQVLSANDPDGTGWVAAYTPGLLEVGNLEAGQTDGQVIWNKCNTLWKKFRSIEIPPSELTDAHWFRDYTSALWYLYNWVNWMGKRRVSFSVPYSLGKDWYVSEHITINFPHHTDGRTINCVVEKLSKNKNSSPSVVEVTAIMIDDITTADAYQDTDAGSVPKWQDIDTGATASYQNID